MPVLASLDLSHNRLKALPPTVTRSRHLVKLKLGHNRLQALPDLSPLSSLRKLGLARNRFLVTCDSVEAKDEREAAARLRLPTSLTYLDLSENKLHSLRGALHPRLKAFGSLLHLDLSRNHISTLPSEINRLSRLRHLDVTCNQLKVGSCPVSPPRPFLPL